MSLLLTQLGAVSNVDPNAVTVTASINAPHIALLVYPGAVTVTASINAPAIRLLIYPGALTVTASVGAPILVGGVQFVDPNALTVTASVGDLLTIERIIIGLRSFPLGNRNAYVRGWPKRDVFKGGRPRRR